MKFVTLAAGFAAGYVLGSRAGHEKYEQITATARRVGDHPRVAAAQEKAKTLLQNGADALTAKLAPSTPVSAAPGAEADRFAATTTVVPTAPVAVVGQPGAPITETPSPRPARRKPSATAPVKQPDATGGAPA